MKNHVSSQHPATLLLAGTRAACLAGAARLAAAGQIILVTPDPQGMGVPPVLSLADDRVRVHHGVLAARAGQASLHVMNFAALSSIRPATSALFQLFPGLKERDRHHVTTVSVADILPDADQITRPFHVVIDSPGSEMDILHGLQEAAALPLIDRLDMTCGSEILYEGAADCATLEHWLVSSGLTIWQRDLSDPDRPVLEFRPQPLLAQEATARTGNAKTRLIATDAFRTPPTASLRHQLLLLERQRDDLSQTLSELRRETAKALDQARSDSQACEQKGQVLKNDLTELRRRFARAARPDQSVRSGGAAASEPAFGPVRMLHHLACTGGTVLSKCVAALPNVLLLSEIDPLSTMQYRPERPAFQPTDLLLASRHAARTDDPELLLDIFHAGLGVLRQHTRDKGQYLVLRDHNHSHFCMEVDPETRPTLRQMMPADARLLSVVTLRHPVDSYLSLIKHGWDIHMSPRTIDEYARRYLAFIDRHEECPKLRYEDFLDDPAAGLTQICTWLDLPYDPQALTLFSAIRMSGDSGRGGDVLSPRDRRAVPAPIAHQISQSESLHHLCDKLGYDL